MTRTTACYLSVAIFCAVGATAPCFAADEPAKTAAARDTLLYVRTKPPGAIVFVDGKKIGTAGGLFHVEPGRVTIHVELDRHKENSCQVTIRANRVTRVDLILEPEAKAADTGAEKKEPTPAAAATPEAGGKPPAAASPTASMPGAKEAQPAPQGLLNLTYQFQTGKQYPYKIKIEAELEDTIETREGVSLYDVLSANAEQMVLKQSGTLRERTQQRPDRNVQVGFPRFPHMFGPHGFPGFGPSGPAGMTFNHHGHLILSKPLTHLPFLLGDLETLVIEELPADGKLSWHKTRDVLAIEQKASAFPHGPFHSGTQSERPAKEQIDYVLVDTQPDAVRIRKIYAFRSAPEANGSAHFEMSGNGDFTFDRVQGVIRALSMEYTINVNEPSLTLRVPVTVKCRLLTAEEFAAYKQEEEKKRLAMEKANAPKPLERAERVALLRDLRSKDENRAQQAADRLAKAVADDDPAPVARALAPWLRNSNEWAAGAAAKAMVVWATPEAEAALIEATTSENLWIRAAAIDALGKLKSEKAADAIAAQMYRNRMEAGKALKGMGPVAENATIGCLKDRDHWVRGEACGVLGEIGTAVSLKALRKYAEQATGFDLNDANRAIAAIEQRLDSKTDDAKPADRAAAGRPAWRVWHDTSGLFEVEAVLVRFEGGKLTLRKHDGRTIVVPLKKLSPSDQEYVARHFEGK
jgi:hypothetical protein